MADGTDFLQLLASLGGDISSGLSQSQAQALLQQSVDQYGNIQPPNLPGIQAQQIQADPQLQASERDALDQLLQLGKSGGLTLEDKANANQLDAQAARTAASANNRVKDQMAARGISGGGAQLAMQLANNQAAGNNAYQNSLQTQGMAQKRALDSIVQGGQMAQSQQSASDARNRYNADAQMRAQQYNAGLPEQGFQNQLAIAQGRSGASGTLAGYYGNQAQRQRMQGLGYGQALGNLGGGGKGGGGGGSGLGGGTGSGGSGAGSQGGGGSSGGTLDEAELYDY